MKTFIHSLLSTLSTMSLALSLSACLVTKNEQQSDTNHPSPASTPTGPLVQFSASTSSGDEGTAAPTVTVTLSEALTSAFSVNYAVTGGTATGGGVDYTLASGTLTFAIGETSKDITLSIDEDVLDELNETIIITLSSPSNTALANLGTRKTHTFTITDNDASPVLQFDSTSDTGDETVTPVLLPVSIDAVSGRSVTVTYTVTGTATGSGSDHSLASGTLTFAAGETSKNISLPIVNDARDEDDETIIVTLSSPSGATLGTDTVYTYTLTDDDTEPTIAFSTASSSGSEATTPGNIAVTLSAASGKTITIGYAVTGGTATGSGTDYTLASGTLTFTAGQTSKNISIAVVNDTLDEDDETVEVTISGPTNATLGVTDVHTYTITDNDSPPTVAFSATTSSGSEATTSVNIPVNLITASSKTVTVNYAVTGGTATGTGTDYTLASGTLTFNAGVTTQNISVTVVNDTLDEANETIQITLSGPTNASLGTNTAHVYTITDDDATPTVAFATASSSGSEGTSPATLTVNLSAASGRTVTVAYARTSGTATGSGTDYTLTSGTLSFAAGETSKTISITIINDVTIESAETIVVTLSSPSNATLGATTAHTFTINDNDSGVTAENFNGPIVSTSFFADGSKLYGGLFTAVNPTTADGLVRISTAGVYDNTCDVTDGFQVGAGIFSNTTVRAIAALSDGTMILGGKFTQYAGTTVSHIIKLNTDCTINSTFNTNIGSGLDGDGVFALAVDGSNNIYVGGTFANLDGNAIAPNLIKLSSAGVLDSSFNTALGAGITGGTPVVTSIVLSGSDLYIAGNFTDFDGNDIPNNIALIGTDGSVDLDPGSFNDTLGSGFDATVSGMTLSGGNLYIGGEFNNLSGNNIADKIAKISTAGVLDSAFDTAVGSGFNANVHSALVSGSDLYLAGEFSTLDGNDIPDGLVKLGTDGSISVAGGSFNATIGTGFQSMGESSTVHSLVLSGTDLYVAGSFLEVNGSVVTSGITKLSTSGVIDSTFKQNATGGIGLSIFSGTPVVTIISSKVVITGGFSFYGGTLTPANIAKVNADSTLDSDFNDNLGIGIPGYVLSSVITNDAIYLGGVFSSFNSVDVANSLVKLDLDGNLDTTFDTNVGSGLGSGAAFALTVSGSDLYVGGSFTEVSGTTIGSLVKFDTDGNMDSTFVSNMGVGFAQSGSNAAIYTIAVSGGNLYVSGDQNQFFNGSAIAAGLTKLSTAGVIDSAFDTALGTGFDETVNSVVVSGSDLYAAGSFSTLNGSNIPPGLVKLGTDGSIDMTGGSFNDTLGTGISGRISSLGMSGTDLYIIGTFAAVNGVSTTFGIAKLDSSGALDSAFDTALTSASASVVGYVFGKISFSDDGEIYPGALLSTIDSKPVSILRIEPDGDLLEDL